MEEDALKKKKHLLCDDPFVLIKIFIYSSQLTLWPTWGNQYPSSGLDKLPLKAE